MVYLGSVNAGPEILLNVGPIKVVKLKFRFPILRISNFPIAPGKVEVEVAVSV